MGAGLSPFINMSEEIEFGPFESTIHEATCLITRSLERLLTLADIGKASSEDVFGAEERFHECVICHMTAKAARPGREDLKIMAQKLDRMSVIVADTGPHGHDLAEEMNLLSSRIRRMIQEDE